AEDGIRDLIVTGVQTCALPISIPAFPTSAPFTSQGVYVIDPHLKVPYSNSWNLAVEKSFQNHQSLSVTYVGQVGQRLLRAGGIRSEERRVGKECRASWGLWAEE